MNKEMAFLFLLLFFFFFRPFWVPLDRSQLSITSSG